MKSKLSVGLQRAKHVPKQHFDFPTSKKSPPACSRVTVSKFWSRTLRVVGADEWGDLSHWCNMHISDIIAGRQGEVSFRFIRLWLRPLTHKSAPPRAPLSLLLFLLSTRWEKEERRRERCAFAASAAAQTRLLSKVEDLIGWCVFNAKTHVTSLINSLVAALRF